MKVLLLDGYNLIYRARYSFMRGEHSTVFSFFRSLRPLVEKFDPDFAYFVIEGNPVKRKELFPEYKANRVSDDDESFYNARRDIIQMMSAWFPVCVCRHPLLECDDVIAHLAVNTHKDDEVVVVSSDTDFIQLYNLSENVTLYNPIKKSIIEKPNYNYVNWKALKGDSSDNIPGIPGIGNKRALKLVSDTQRLGEFLQESKEKRTIFERNKSLIEFEKIEDVSAITWSPANAMWDEIKTYFEDCGFNSITNQKSWLKFQSTFNRLCEGEYSHLAGGN
jgi:DNA polymerase-1